MFTTVTPEMLDGVLDGVTSLIPIVAPTVIAFIGFRKAWGFLRRSISGA